MISLWNSSDKPMNEVGKIQLIALRLFYFLTGASFGFLANLDFATGARQSLTSAVLYAFALLAFAGVIRPLKMLPLLFFSITWKSVWLIVFAIPMYVGAGPDELTKNILLPVFSGLIVTALVIPWKYTVNNYLTNAS